MTGGWFILVYHVLLISTATVTGSCTKYFTADQEFFSCQGGQGAVETIVTLASPSPAIRRCARSTGTIPGVLAACLEQTTVVSTTNEEKQHAIFNIPIKHAKTCYKTYDRLNIETLLPQEQQTAQLSTVIVTIHDNSNPEARLGIHLFLCPSR